MMFGERLKAERLNKGLSQEELGKLVNKTKNGISQYETGKREPDLETLNRFAEIFSCSIDYLMGKSDAKKQLTKEQMANELMQVLIDTGEIEPGEELTDEKRERLLKMVRKAIELSKL